MSNIYDHRGHFVDAAGNEADHTVADLEAFPILCGAWPNPHTHAIQQRCGVCQIFVGISPKGLQYHAVNPELRPLLCGICFPVFMDLLEALHEEDKP